ncbi:MAG: DUF305 domain-containing protein [Phyllobacterium sp.]
MIAPPKTRTIAMTASMLVLAVAMPAFAEAPHHHDGAAATIAEAPFLKENDAAMTKMMNAMAVKPTGNIDRDFIEMMIPHHQGAIDMAQAYLRYGGNEQLKRIAQEIVIEQLQEIAAMRLALGDPLPASAAAPTRAGTPPPASDTAPAMPGMDHHSKMGH